MQRRNEEKQILKDADALIRALKILNTKYSGDGTDISDVVKFSMENVQGVLRELEGIRENKPLRYSDTFYQARHLGQRFASMSLCYYYSGECARCPIEELIPCPARSVAALLEHQRSPIGDIIGGVKEFLGVLEAVYFSKGQEKEELQEALGFKSEKLAGEVVTIQDDWAISTFPLEEDVTFTDPEILAASYDMPIQHILDTFDNTGTPDDPLTALKRTHKALFEIYKLFLFFMRKDPEGASVSIPLGFFPICRMYRDGGEDHMPCELCPLAVVQLGEEMYFSCSQDLELACTASLTNTQRARLLKEALLILYDKVGENE